MSTTVDQSNASGRSYALLALEIVLVALGYFVVAKLSLDFASINPSATPIWPPTGLALALVLLRGDRILPGILVGAFAVNLVNSGALALAAPIAIGNSLEAFIGALLLRRWAGGKEAFLTPAGVVRFAIIVLAAAAPTSATIGVVALCASGHETWANFLPVWITWWLGDLAGAVLVGPAMVLWAHARRFDMVTGEALALIGGASVIGALAFSPISPAPDSSRNALAFLAILPLLWSALRLGSRNTAVIALVLSAFAIWGVQAGVSPFIQDTRNDSFLLLVAFVLSATLPSLALSAAVAARDDAASQHAEDYHLLVDSVRDYAIYMLNPEGQVNSWNAGAERIKQYSEAEIVGRQFHLFYTEEDRAAKVPEKALAQAATTGRYEAEGWRVRRDGTRFWASVVLTAIRGPQGETIGFAKVTRDISERRAAQVALEQAQGELLQSQKLEALGQLTGGVAHDFNNLLMAITGGLRALERRPEQRAQTMIALRQAIDRGVGLTRQLLAFARKETLRPETVDTAEALAGVQRLLPQSLRETIRVETEVADDVWPVTVDRNQLELALLNLALNARDAMPNGGVLTLSARNETNAKGEFVRFTVADTGEGMTPEVLAHAFEPFFSTKATGDGTGLGLAQVYGFAAQSGGAASIDSAPGKGARVSVTLPRATHVESVVRETPTPAPFQSARVLVVEDDDSVALTVCDMLEDMGHIPTRVPHARAALEALQEQPFDIVFSDIVMPGGMNGVELADEVRRIRPHLPVVLTTGYTGGAEVNEDVVPLLRKPYDPEDLAAAFAQAFERARLPASN